MGKVHPELTSFPNDADTELQKIEEVFDAHKEKAGAKKLRLAVVSHDVDIEIWGHGSGGLLKKITVGKARSLKLAKQKGKGAELQPKPSCCGLCCFMCGCSKQLPVLGAAEVNLAGIEQKFRTPVFMVVAGMPDGNDDVRILGEILTESGYAKADSGVWSRAEIGGGIEPPDDMKR